jgi:hypothetical protein
MHSSTATYFPTRAITYAMRALRSCHTLITSALGPKGEKLAKFPSRCLPGVAA